VKEGKRFKQTQGYNGGRKTLQNLWSTEGYSYKKKRPSNEDLFILTFTGYPSPSKASL